MAVTGFKKINEGNSSRPFFISFNSNLSFFILRAGLLVFAKRVDNEWNLSKNN